MIDMDSFKHINDTYGHMVGDLFLKSFGFILKENKEIEAGRFGGEEFVILFSETSKEDAIMVAERIRQKVADFVFPFEEKQPNGDLTISVGVAFSPSDAIEKQSLLQIADERLYKAKSSGRNRVVWE